MDKRMQSSLEKSELMTLILRVSVHGHTQLAICGRHTSQLPHLAYYNIKKYMQACACETQEQENQLKYLKNRLVTMYRSHTVQCDPAVLKICVSKPMVSEYQEKSASFSHWLWMKEYKSVNYDKSSQQKNSGLNLK